LYGNFRRSAIVALGMGIVALATTGCTGGSSGEPVATSSKVNTAPPSGSATSASSDEETAKAKALEAYRGMWADMSTAGKTSDYKSPLLARHATGNALKQIVQSLYLDSKDGVVGRGEPALNPRVGSADVRKQPARVVVEDCADSTKWLRYDSKSGELADTPGGRRHISADVRGLDGSWKVVDFRVRRIGSC
jgi:hypothetical protein